LREERDPEEAQQYPQPPDEAAEVVADRGEYGVVEVALAVGKIVAAHSVIFFEMADDGLDGGAASHLSFDLWGHPSLLLGCIDFELVIGRRVVAAVSGIGVKPFDGIADELLDRRDHLSQSMAVVGIARQRCP
jgi:hypothetical protein